MRNLLVTPTWANILPSSLIEAAKGSGRVFRTGGEQVHKIDSELESERSLNKRLLHAIQLLSRLEWHLQDHPVWGSAFQVLCGRRLACGQCGGSPDAPVARSRPLKLRAFVR